MKMFGLFAGTLFYGVIINIAVLTLVDSRNCSSPPCDPYIFYLAISLGIGFLISYLSAKRSKSA